jgi:hypothetical protein
MTGGEMIWTVSSLSRFACSATLFAVACTQAAHADPKITAVANAIQLQDGQTSGSVGFLFKVDGLKEEPKVLVYSTSQGGPGFATSGKPTKVAELTNGAFWQVPGFVSNLPLNSSFDALLVVQVGNTISDVLSYSISNKLPSVDADVSPGSDTIFLDKYRETDFTVNVKGRPLRGLAVCQSALADTNTGNHLPEEYLGMYLAGPDIVANPQMDSPYLTLTAASTKVHLFVFPTFKDRGVFTGTIGLCSASKAAVATLKMTVNSTSLTARVAGAFLIVMGISLYVLVTVVLKQRSHQLAALLPAARLVEASNGLRQTAEQVEHRAEVKLPVLLGDKRVLHSLEWLISQLAISRLKDAGYLPPLLTNPFQPPDPGTDYQQYLQGISAQEVNYAIIVGDGLVRVMSLWQQLDEGSAREALVKLDQLALEADFTSDPMRPKVDALVNAIAPRRKEFAAMLTDAHNNFRAGGGSTPSVHEITVQLDSVSGIGWIIWAFLTFLFGCSVLILSNHGFGTWQDLLKCFLWGLGIQATGQGLQALAPSSAATTFSLQIGH